MAGSINVDKRTTVNSGGILYSTVSMNSNKRGGHEPPDVFCGLASLIVEGRVPRPDGGKDGRGVYHGEGPHSLRHYGPGSAIWHGHECSGDDYMCKKDENFRKHMLLLWQNNVPVSIEVLLCSNCRVGRQKANSVEYSTIPEPGSILLEQWTVSISNNFKQRSFNKDNTSTVGNFDQHAITARGLFQAVRSYLHFSQLSAWYDSFRGTEPSSVLYRITIPGEAFASKFSCQPEQHYFPPAAVGSMALVNVAVRSYPRTDKIPTVICTHNRTDVIIQSPNTSSSPSVDILASESSSTSISPTCGSNGEQMGDPKSLPPVTHLAAEENKLSMAGALAWKETERLETDLRRMTLVKNRLTECTLNNTAGVTAELPRSDSMDSMLGDSLLDPPQDLQKMPPKRYQSPSRCGSPSVEAPDHLLFRSHYHYNENGPNANQLYSTVGAGDKNSESARNRLARQDLLRRRDIGQTLGMFGACHGLHPRMLHSIGQTQPRLSLPPKTISPIVNPCMSTNGPYRAFPPERGFHHQIFYDSSIKCNISGKHICKDKTEGDEIVSCPNVLNQDVYEKAHHDNNQLRDLEVTAQNDSGIKECGNEGKEPLSLNSSSQLTESPQSFFLGGAKKKSAIATNQANKNHKEGLSPILPRRHYKQISFESDEDDTGIEVAEYDISDINNSLLPRHQTTVQKELDDILDGLAPDKFKCSSRRSSLKDEDRLFPHKCKCTGGSSQPKNDLLEQGYRNSPIPKLPVITQVYRAETQTPPLVSSPSLHVKSADKRSNRASNSPVPSNVLDKADILLGAILRTSERNKHLEVDDLLSTDSSSSSRADSRSPHAIRKSPEDRKNSAGDADDEDEDGENTSSDNGSSILSSYTTSEDEDNPYAQLKQSDNAHWYKNRSRGIPNRGRRKKLGPETSIGHKVSDTSSSMCLLVQPRPSSDSSTIEPPAPLNADQLPSADYTKTQNVCDKERWSNIKRQTTIYKGDGGDSRKVSMSYNEMIPINSKHSANRSMVQEIVDETLRDGEKNISRDDQAGVEGYQYETTLEMRKKLNSDNLLPEVMNANERERFHMSGENANLKPICANEPNECNSPNFTSATNNRVQRKHNQKCQDGCDTKNYDVYTDADKNMLDYPFRGSTGFNRLRTRSENLHTFPSETLVKEPKNAAIQGKSIHCQNHHNGNTNPRLNKIVTDSNTHTSAVESQNFKQYLEPLDICFDDNYETDVTTRNERMCYGQKENHFQDPISDLEEEKCLDSNAKRKSSTSSNSKEVSNYDATSNINNGISIPTMVQKDSFRKTLNSATSMVFHRKTGLPLSSSPAPLRKGKHDFGYDSSINAPTDIKRALYQRRIESRSSSRGARKQTNLRKSNQQLNSAEKTNCGFQGFDCSIGTEDMDEDESEKSMLYRSKKKKRQGTIPTEDDIYIKKRNSSVKRNRILSASAPAAVSSQGSTATNLLGTFEESVLNGRLEPVSTVEGFTAEIGASGSFHPKHKTVPVTVFFYNMCCDNSPSISSPYLGHINLGKKGYRVPQSGTIQVTLFNPLGTVVKMFVAMYDLSDMPPNSQTFLRQRTFYMPTSDSIYENDMEISRDGSMPVGASQKWLRYLIHLRFASSKSGKIYLHSDIRMIIFRKSDLDTATDHNITPGKFGGFELRSFTNGPINPKFSPRKINFRQEE